MGRTLDNDGCVPCLALDAAASRDLGPQRSFEPTGASCPLLPRGGRVASALDNSMMESFFGTLQLELLDRQAWMTRAELARAIFEWIEGWYNPRRRHTSIGNLSPVDYERRPVPTTNAA